jgi:hypothetical protein
MNYTISEKHLKAFQDILECAQSQILEPTSISNKMIALRMTENGMTLIELIKKQREAEATLNNFANADEQGLEFELDVDRVREFGHERDQFQL